MRRIFALFLLVPLGALLLALAVVNRKPVTLGLNPFDANSGLVVEAPLFLFLLGAFAIGLIVGGLATWYEQGKWRVKARREAREARTLRAQAERLEKELENAGSRPGQARLPAA
jgi:uncharacterized integral membrane protein